MHISDKRSKSEDTRTPAELEPPAKGNKVYYDSGHKSAVAGFGVRVTARGARSFILTYRNQTGRQRRLTIGSYPNWGVGAARDEARELRRRIDRGEDPLEELQELREADTVADLSERYIEEHLPTKRPTSQRNDRAMIETHILPALGSRKVREVEYEHVSNLHRKITKIGKPYLANRVLSLLRKMFALSIRWKMRPDNPCNGVERNIEDSRERYLTIQEVERLMRALVEFPDRQAANIVMLALLTGARIGEVRNATWDQFREPGIWTKPSSHTKQKKTHRTPLSASAVELIGSIKKEAPSGATYVFPGRDDNKPRYDIKSAWQAIRKAADLEDVRLHDLRHSFASFLIGDGVSIEIIGRLLGHTQAQTTRRYTHLADDPLRDATNRVGRIVKPK